MYHGPAFCNLTDLNLSLEQGRTRFTSVGVAHLTAFHTFHLVRKLPAICLLVLSGVTAELCSSSELLHMGPHLLCVPGRFPCFLGPSHHSSPASSLGVRSSEFIELSRKMCAFGLNYTSKCCLHSGKNSSWPSSSPSLDTFGCKLPVGRNLFFFTSQHLE